MTHAEAAWRRRFRAARISLPDWGRDAPDRLLYASNAHGKWELYAWDRTAEMHRRVTDRPEGTLFGGLDPAGRRVWWFDDERGSEHGVWRAEPFEGGETALAAPGIDPGYSAGLALGRDLAVVGSSDDGGTRVHLVTPDGPPRLLYRHEQHAGVAGLSRHEMLLCLSHSEHGDTRHPAVRVMDLHGVTVAELSDGPGLGLWPAGWSPVHGDRRLLVLHERRELLRPMVWSPETGETVDLEVNLPGEVDASWYPDASAVLLAHDHRGRTELFRFDLGTRVLEPIPTEPGSIGDARVRPDGELWYAWSRSSTPPEVRGPAGVVLRAPGDPAPAGVPYRELDVDGVPAFVAEPEASGPHPVVFLVHGGPESHDRDSFSPRAQAFVDHGFAVVLVNYRGSTGYGKAWRDAITGNPGLTELEDLARVRDAVVGSGVADRDRVVLAGASWGGYLTLLGLGLQPERWSLGIADVPVGDYVAAYEDEMEPLKAYDRALFGASPDEDLEAYVRRSPITYVDRVRVPLLVLLGENDARCPARQVDNYLTRLREVGKPHELYRYDAGHGSLVVEETIRQVEVQLSFIARHLGTRPPM